MLTELSATNFKSWPKLGPMPLAPLTGLFGTNSSGKTSVLQLLLMLRQTVESSDRAAVLEFGDDRSSANLGSFRDVVFGHKKPGSIEFSVSWMRDKPLVIKNPQRQDHILFTGQKVSFQASINETELGRPMVSTLSYGINGSSFIMRRKLAGSSKKERYELVASGSDFRYVRSQGRAWELPAPVKCYGFPDQVYAYYQNAGFLAELQLSLEEMLKQVYYLGPLREFPQRHYTWPGSEPADMGRRGERVVHAILASRKRGPYISPGYRKKKQTLEERVAYWLKELGLIYDFSVRAIADESNQYQIRVQKAPDSAQVLITDVGFGVSQILPVLVLCYYVPERSTILFEQPEIHLHPSVQSGLADVFIDVIKNRDVQVIVESHSEHLLRRFQRRMAEEKLARDQAAFYFCEMTNGGSALTTLDLDLFGTIKNWPKDFFGDEFGEIAATTEAAMKRRQSQPA
jgi:hypothetical protein